MMLSYQHSYHAGCLADVHKHMILCVLLQRLTQKDKPLTYMETHAGRGLYDLSGEEALKTGEAAAGIQAYLREQRILQDHPYMQVLQQIQSRYGKDAYPGSPLFAKSLLREQDQLHLMELHPQEFEALRRNLRMAHVHKRDGYEGVLALSPPTPRRGLVLIDPSYEIKKDYAAMSDFIQRFHKKWPQATMMLWYPHLPAAYHQGMVKAIENADLPAIWRQDVLFPQLAPGRGMSGSGVILINTPYGVTAALDQVAEIF